jgi:signal transduction histidine kinase
MRLTLRRRPSARLRLTLTYTALFVLAGGMLLGFNYLLMEQRLDDRISGHLRERIEARLGGPLPTPEHGESSPSERAQLHPILEEAAREFRADALRQLLIQSGVALAAMAAISAGLGWLMAGRVLRPLQEITATARRMSESHLHQRIALQGPQDELKELADTFDDMLARLDTSFESQKQFVANASHELRTPLSIIRAELDVTLSNPDVSQAELQEMAEVVRGAVARSERLIESLLFLARSESGLPERRSIDLAAVARDVIGDFALAAEGKGVVLREDLSPAVVAGDPPLLQRLAGNLVENALAYNHQGGWIEISTRQTQRGAELRVTNSGPVVPAESIDSLFQPFRRLEPDRTASSSSVGLGLSIVRAIARAHGGEVTAQPGTSGGLEVVVRLPTIKAPKGKAIQAPIS